TYFGLPIVADRAILLPTAEEDPLIRAAALERFFALPAGYLFLTPEEEALVAERARIRVPAAVIGCGIAPKKNPDIIKRNPDVISDPFVLYLGRVDPNKGCDALIRYFSRYAAGGRAVALVLAGPVNMPVPDHPSVRT